MRDQDGTKGQTDPRSPLYVTAPVLVTGERAMPKDDDCSKAKKDPSSKPQELLLKDMDQQNHE